MPKIAEQHADIQRVWNWLQINIKEPVLLSIMLALLEEDLEMLETINQATFARSESIGIAAQSSCSQQLEDLNLSSVMFVSCTLAFPPSLKGPALSSWLTIGFGRLGATRLSVLPSVKSAWNATVAHRPTSPRAAIASARNLLFEAIAPLMK